MDYQNTPESIWIPKSHGKITSEVAEPASKLTNLLKRLTCTKWECKQNFLATAHNKSILPTMEYISEVRPLASRHNLQKLDIIQNITLRLLSPAQPCSTPIGAMVIQTGTEPFITSKMQKTNHEALGTLKKGRTSALDPLQTSNAQIKNPTNPSRTRRTIKKKV